MEEKKLALALLLCLVLSNTIKAEVPIKDCGEHTIQPGETVIIQSEDYPNQYPEDQDCTWDFKVPDSPDSRIKIFCDHVNLRHCTRSLIVISDDVALDETFCRGTASINESSTTNRLEVQFRATWQGKFPDGGFQCSITASDPYPKTVIRECECGKTTLASKIVGGQESEIHEYPWQVGLTSPDSNKPFCGGSIISNTWVLTAAHCVTDETTDSMKVVVGEHDYSISSETAATGKLDVSEIIVHPNYDSSSYDSDLALLKLATPLSFTTDDIAPICLPPYGNLYEGVDAVATGWGLLEEDGSQPTVLYEVTVPTMTNVKCDSFYIGDITDNMICAGLDEGGKDSCQGDSGGPLITASDSTNKYELIGVTSWGSGCAQASKPGVYVRVNKFLTWIQEETSGSIYCSKS